MRLILHCAAYVLHQHLRVHVLKHTGLASAQPATVILKLFKVVGQIRQYKDHIVLHLPSTEPASSWKTAQYKDHIVLHLPSTYPFKHLLWILTERLFLVKPLASNTS